MNPRIFSIAIAALLCIAKRQSMLSLLLITLPFLTAGAALAATSPSAAPIQSSSFPATAFPSQVSPTLPGLSYPERPHPNVTPRSYRAQMFHGRKPDYTSTVGCDYYNCTYGFNAEPFDSFSVSIAGIPDSCGEYQPWSASAGQDLGGGIIIASASTSASQGTFQMLVEPGSPGGSFQIGEQTNGGFCQFPAYYTNVFAAANIFIGVPSTAPSLYINTPCGPCSSHSSSGDPVDVMSGAFSERKTDLEMPGPFGLEFSRYYNSETRDSGDLGSHWSDSFSDTAFVYTAVVAPSSPGPTTSSLRARKFGTRKRDLTGGYVEQESFYLDSDQKPHFYGPSGGYDPVTATTLTEDPSGLSSTLTFFDGRVLNFDTAGKLVKKTDRIGNTQTITRDSNERILNVQDSLGRQLCFYYNGADPRVVSVGEWFHSSACPATANSTSASVTFTYDSGNDPLGNPNCGTSQLCSVTEPDGRIWTYGYDINNGGYTSNLTAIYDPLGNPEVVNTYSGYAIATQHRGNAGQVGGNLKFTYPQPLPTSSSDPLGHTQVTNPDTGEVTDYYFNQQAMVTSISGKLCNCHGYQAVNYTYDVYDRLLSESDVGNQGFYEPYSLGITNITPSGATPAPSNHVISYTYDRDTTTFQYPGPTTITEVLDASGGQRKQLISYYPVGDPRQDLPLTIQWPSVDSAGQMKTTTYTYSSNGLLQQKDEMGYVLGSPVTHTTKMTYDSRGRMLSSTLPRTDVNTISTMAYFPDTDSDLMRAGQLYSTTDALGHKDIVSGGPGSAYDAYGHPLTITDANGVAVTKAYDAWGRVLSTTILGVSGDPMNLTEQNVYDGAGRMVGRKRPLGNGEAFTLDSAGRVVAATRVDSASLQHEQMVLGYDSADELISRAAQGCAQPASTCASWTTTTAYGYAYDTFGELVTIADPSTNFLNGPISSAVIDSAALLPDYKYIGYTNQGRPAAAVDENHDVEGGGKGCGDALICVSNYGWTYDLAGRVTTAQRFLLAATVNPESNYVYTNYAYDVDDNVTAVTDPNGNVTSYHYDDFGNKLSEISPVSGTTSYRYDADDNLSSTTDAAGATTNYSYDALDRPVQSVSVKPSMPTETVTWTYDDTTPGHFGIGRLASMSDPTGSTSYTYERRGLTTMERRVLDGNVFTQRYAYDGNANRTSMTYADGLTIAYGYDFADRPYSVTQIVGGNLVASARTRIPSIAALPARRGASRPTTLRPSENNKSFAQLSTSRNMFPLSQLSLRKRGSFSGTFAHVPASLHPREKVDAQARRALAILSQIQSIPLPSHHVAFSRYVNGAANSVIVASTVYAPYGPMVMQTFGNGTTQTVTVDARYRPSNNVLTNAAGTIITSFKYSEDPSGNITSIVDTLDALYSRAYIYDDMNRLVTSVTGPAANAVGVVYTQTVPSTIATPSPSVGVGLWGTAVYQYDRMGNMLNQQIGPRVDNFRYSGTTSNLTNVISTDLVGGQIANDADGNETAIGPNSYGYSARNEMVRAGGPPYVDLTVNPISVGSATTPTLSVGNPWTYKYDGFGTRLSTTINEIAPTISTGSIGTLPTVGIFKQPTRYSIPGPDGQLATETSTTTIGAPEYDYIWMGEKPVAQIDATGTHFDFTDHLNAPIVQTSVSGAISYQADYEPFGKIFALRGTTNPHQPLRLPGQTAEQFENGANGATDLFYNNARWYRPEWGRYSQSDPIGLALGDNLFDYVEDDPTGLVDPNGLFPIYKNPFSRLPYDNQECADLLEKMANLLRSIGKRTAELREDKYNLPERAVGDLIRGSLSRAGHRILRTVDEINLSQQRGEYDRFCDDPPPGATCPDALPNKLKRSTARWWSNYPSEQPPWWVRTPFLPSEGDGVGPIPGGRGIPPEPIPFAVP